ncbi:MAG TPA: hypothetical protein VFE53_19435 [Mucilaginibacter sp.]|nr:hypothetical protein [Mucilaginibacter sp.]
MNALCRLTRSSLRSTTLSAASGKEGNGTIFCLSDSEGLKPPGSVFLTGAFNIKLMATP